MRYESGGVAKNTIQDLWDKVAIGGLEECWLWKEACFSNGYGRFKWNYHSFRAHRLVLSFVKGPPPIANALALHSCHVRSCCNPLHLRWGTHAENMKDRSNRVRAKAIPTIPASTGL